MRKTSEKENECKDNASLSTFAVCTQPRELVKFVGENPPGRKPISADVVDAV